MNKLLKILLAVALAVVSVFGMVGCTTPDAGNTTPGIQFKKYINEEFYTVYGYVDDGKTQTLEIPDKKDNLPVGRIESGAFKNNGSLKSIIVPQSVTEIGAGAFAGMTNLESITLPFVGAKPNADVKLFDTKEDVDKAVDAERNFAYIFGAEEYENGISVTAYHNTEDSNVYYIPLKLKTVTIKNQAGYNIPMYAFNGLFSLRNIKLEGNITAIGENAFEGCAGLKNITIPAKVTKIYDKAFMNSGLTSITFEENSALKEIGAYAFASAKITELTLPAGVEIIGESAFALSKLTKVELSASLKTIGNYGFYGCEGLASVSGSATNVQVGNGAFKNCKKLVKSSCEAMFNIGSSQNVFEGTK